MFGKHKLFGNTVPPACQYCEHGQPTADPNLILCVRHGAVSPTHQCRRYVYDPLKRVPRRPPCLPEFSPEDFKLD